jgi:hypothetical protein
MRKVWAEVRPIVEDAYNEIISGNGKQYMYLCRLDYILYTFYVRKYINTHVFMLFCDDVGDVM